MKIDRHNYEEYFMLYMDNELTVDQKKQVELFVSRNPDLEEELVMFQQSRLVADDTISFDNKEMLMKEENGSFINMGNYEEWLVLYADNELTAQEQSTVEQFAATHPHVQKELQLFQQTKLQPEKIVFAHKESLYKKETVTIISMQWFRIAIAAILIIAGGLTLFSVLNKKETAGEIPKEVASTTTNPVKETPKTTDPDQQKQNATVVNEQPQNATAETGTQKEKKEQEQVINKTFDEPKPQQLLAYNAPVENTKPNEVREPAQSEINNNTKEITQSPIDNVATVDAKPHKDFFNGAFVTNASDESLNKSTSEDVQYASNTENKKFRGFFRKATRIIERTTNIKPADDDDKVLIGGMAINLR